MGRNLKWTENTIERLIKEGRGSGEGTRYRPWLTVQNVSSEDSRQTRVTGIKSGRVHHFLSDLEYYIFLFLEWSLDVSDIREQFPLEREITRALAQEMGIAHPKYDESEVDTVMTTDFFVTKGSGPSRTYVAINAKPASKLNDFRTIEKLAIQHAYHTGMGIEHYILTRESFDPAIGKNLDLIRMALPRRDEIMPADQFLKHEAQLLDAMRYADQRQSLASFCARHDSVAGCEPGFAFRIAKILMQKRKIYAPLSSIAMDTALLSELLDVRHVAGAT